MNNHINIIINNNNQNDNMNININNINNNHNNNNMLFFCYATFSDVLIAMIITKNLPENVFKPQTGNIITIIIISLITIFKSIIIIIIMSSYVLLHFLTF